MYVEYINRVHEFVWRPINTAPVDGTRVLIQSVTGYVCIGKFEDECWRTDTLGEEISPILWTELPRPLLF